MSDEDERALQIASFRYRVIADAAEEATTDGATAAIQQAASRKYADPSGGSPVGFCTRTLWRWLSDYRQGGLFALRPKPRKDSGQIRVVTPKVLALAESLRRKNNDRPTKTIIDYLVRTKKIEPGALARSTLDRHFAQMGLSRRQLRSLSKTTYKKILSEAPFELVIADFHHGPYVRVGQDDTARRALLLVFIDHFSRYIVEARYYLHEDFEALRFGFRRLLITFGLFVRLYIDNGASFQSKRFHAACTHEALDIKVVHSKPYISEGRGACERFNRTIKEQFETEVRHRDEHLTLDELNAYLEAWLAERYHRDKHSETGQAPLDRFLGTEPLLRPAPDSSLLDELLRLRAQRKVHRKWSTVQLHQVRYVVDPTLRNRKVNVLYDPFEPSYVLIELDKRIIQRAFVQQPGQEPPEPPESPSAGQDVDYLAVLKADHDARSQAEIKALRLRRPTAPPELSLIDLVALVEICRAVALSRKEHSEVAAFFRKMRPIEPDAARLALDGVRRRLGTSLHVRVYLDALHTTLVRQRTKGDSK